MCAARNAFGLAQIARYGTACVGVCVSVVLQGSEVGRARRCGHTQAAQPSPAQPSPVCLLSMLITPADSVMTVLMYGFKC